MQQLLQRQSIDNFPPESFQRCQEAPIWVGFDTSLTAVNHTILYIWQALCRRLAASPPLASPLSVPVSCLVAAHGVAALCAGALPPSPPLVSPLCVPPSCPRRRPWCRRSLCRCLASSSPLALFHTCSHRNWPPTPADAIRDMGRTILSFKRSRCDQWRSPPTRKCTEGAGMTRSWHALIIDLLHAPC
jgi:hypothetical protein